MDRQRIRVLILDERLADAELMVRELEQSGFELEWTRVETEAEFAASLDTPLDVILADSHVREFDTPRARQLVADRGSDVPLIVISGDSGDETTIGLSRAGQAVQRAIDERRFRRATHEAELALVAAEERIGFALEAARVGIWEADVRSGAIRFSEMLETLHGLPAGSFPGTLPALVARIDPDDRAQVLEVIERAAGQRTDASVVYRTRWPDGSVHWISGSGRVFVDDAGTPIRAAGIGLDVTERVRLEDQYRQVQKMEAVGQLAGGIAHDFNNLLTAIEGYCMLIAEGLPADSPHQPHLAEVRRAAERATGLTRQLLAFSRRQILEPRVLELRESLRSMEPMLRRLIGEDIEVVVRAARATGRVKADPGQIEQVILNLAINARDAMPKGGTLTLDVSDDTLGGADARDGATVVPGPYVLLTVSDTGEGMDEATRARVFEPFFTTKHKGKGTGLGLSTVYGIVKQSGGYIWLDSAPGGGATFRVYLPRVDEAVEPAVGRNPTGSLRGSETILVVEDEESVRLLVRKVLERYGYTVLTAATPSEATDVAAATTAPIALLISDVVLPQMSGRALADRIIPSKPGIRVLFMSGYTDDAIVHHGVLDAGTPFIQKPFTPQGLALKVREVLA